MTTPDRLDQIAQQLTKGKLSYEGVARELRELLQAAPNDANFRSLLRTAIVWAEAAANPQQSERYGGEAQVREFLLGDLTVARSMARRTGKAR